MSASIVEGGLSLVLLLVAVGQPTASSRNGGLTSRLMEAESLPDSDGQPENTAENQVLRPMAPVPDSWPGVDEAIAAAAQGDVPQLRNLVWRAALLDSVADLLAWLHHYEEILRDPDAIPGGTEVADLAVHQMVRRQLQLVLIDEGVRGWVKAEGHDPDELARLGDATRPSSVRNLLDHPLLRVFCTRNAITRLRDRAAGLRIAAPEHEYTALLPTLRKLILARVGPIVPRHLADHDQRIARLAEAVIAREADHAPPLAPLVDLRGPRTPEVLLAAVEYLALLQKRAATVAAPVAQGASGPGESLPYWRQLAADFNALGQILAGAGVANPALVARLRVLLASAGQRYAQLFTARGGPTPEAQWWLARLCAAPCDELFNAYHLDGLRVRFTKTTAKKIINDLSASQHEGESRMGLAAGERPPTTSFVARLAFIEAIHEDLAPRFPDRPLNFPRRRSYLGSSNGVERNIDSDYFRHRTGQEVEQWLQQLIGAAAEACRVLAEESPATSGGDRVSDTVPESAVPPSHDSVSPAIAQPSVIVRHPTAYMVTFRGKPYSLASGDGADRLIRLLLNPRRQFTATEILGDGAGEKSRARVASSEDIDAADLAGPSVDEILDPQALGEYRRRLSEITQESDEARRNNDEAALDRLREEQEAIRDQVRQATGRAGSNRRLDPEERTRQNSVSVSIKRAVDWLADDLKSFIRDRLRFASGRNRYEPRPDDGAEATFVQMDA